VGCLSTRVAAVALVGPAGQHGGAVEAEEVTAWQSRPLEAFYPVIYLDALVVKIRDGAHVANRAAHIAVGVDMDGIKHVLGIWIQASEGAKFWAGVCAQLANRGVKDVLIVCCDGLTGFPEAIEATWSKGDRANLRGAPDPSLDAVGVLQRPQGRRRAAAPDLHRARPGRRAERAGHVRRLDDGPQVPSRGRLLGGRVGTVHPVPGLRAGAAQGHLHDEQHRYLQPSWGCRSCPARVLESEQGVCWTWLSPVCP